MRLKTRNAIVTGGSRGIGRAIAAALTVAGAEVTILGRSRGSLDAAIGAGVAAHAEVVDVADRAALVAVLGKIDALRPTDILVNNAGTALSKPFAKADSALFQMMLDQHVLAPSEAARALLPGMVARGRGRIVNIGSTASVQGYAYFTAYVAAKHALLGLTRALALEVAKTGVTVNCICPGFALTDLVTEGFSARAAKEGRPVEELLAEFAATKPMGRLIRPEEVADTVLWLAGDGTSAVTGQAIIVDGGESVS